ARERAPGPGGPDAAGDRGHRAVLTPPASARTAGVSASTGSRPEPTARPLGLRIPSRARDSRKQSLPHSAAGRYAPGHGPHTMERCTMRYASIPPVSILLILLAGCGAQSPVAPVLDPAAGPEA